MTPSPHLKFRRLRLFFLLLAVYPLAGTAQPGQQAGSPAVRPRLVIGIVVDQMRYDYLYRYSDKFGDGGFKRLLGQGFLFTNTHFNYIPTYTGPGHASVYTGTTPSLHGIIANDWYDRTTGENMYVTQDRAVAGVGGQGSHTQMSPRNLLSTTVTDELRLATNRRSKVIGVSLKDRGSILPAGHLANGAYWYEDKTGHWVTSTFYMKALPEWVKRFNDRKLADRYLSKPWQTLFPLESYKGGLPDGSPYRRAYKGEKFNRFPHDLPRLQASAGRALLKATPMGNTFTLDMALEAIREEKLGQGPETDFLTISFSSTDYVGHQFGIQSIEVQDTYARLDREIERLLGYVDQHFGADQVLMFLTADHAAAETPAHMQALQLPGGIFDSRGLQKNLTRHLSDIYGEGDWVSRYQNQQIYLNRKLIAEKRLDLRSLTQSCEEFIAALPGVYKTFSMEDLAGSGHDLLETQLHQGIHPLRSGDVVFQLLPGWFDAPYAAAGGTTHGSGYSYDTHVPLIWYGWKVKHGTSASHVSITDVAVTVSDLLHIAQPSAATGTPLSDYLVAGQ